MADAYRIGVSIALANGVSPVLAIIGRDLLGLNASVRAIEGAFGRWTTALLGVAGILGGTAIIGGLAAIAKHGGEVNHQLELMKVAGMDNADIQAAMGQAMKTSGNVMTTTLSENLAHIRELRYAFGETSTAMLHLDEISKSNSVLNAITAKHGVTGGQDQVWALVKSLEQKGTTFNPAEFSSYVDTMTKVVEATGGKVTPEMFMSTFKYGRTAMLGWDESFVGGALPRLMQSMASGGGGGGNGQGGPGNALMSAFAKVVQGQMPKKAAEEWERMGLVPGGVSPIDGSSEAMLGDITSKDLFMKNPYEWVQRTLMPALAKKGITEQNAIIEQISKMFPVRTASQIISEMALQGRYHEGQKSPFEKDIALQKGAMGLSGFDELAKHDYPTLLKEFNQQWVNLLQTLGSPLMEPGGPVLSAMAGLATMMNSISQFAAANPEAVKYMGYALAAIAAALVALGGIALASLIGIPAGLTALVGAVAALGALEWDRVRGYLLAFNDAVTDVIKAVNALASTAWQGIVTMFDGIASAIRTFIASLAAIGGKIRGLFSNSGKVPGVDNPMGDVSPIPQNFKFDPGTKTIKATPIALSLNVDGRTLAQSISEQLEQLYEHATGSPNYNGQSHFNRADGQIMGT